MTDTHFIIAVVILMGITAWLGYQAAREDWRHKSNNLRHRVLAEAVSEGWLEPNAASALNHRLHH